MLITGVALLFAAGFFGYMLALLQRRVLGMVSATEVILPNCFCYSEENIMHTCWQQGLVMVTRAGPILDHVSTGLMNTLQSALGHLDVASIVLLPQPVHSFISGAMNSLY